MVLLLEFCLISQVILLSACSFLLGVCCVYWRLPSQLCFIESGCLVKATNRKQMLLEKQLMFRQS